jgi:peroxiredoxin
MTIQVGAEAPDFELASSEIENDRPGKKIRLSSFRGKKNVVLAFYPLDFSPVCSAEHACFVRDLPSLDGVDAQLLGISVDSVWTHAAFKKHLGLSYPLLADFQPRGDTAAKYGLFLADRGITARATVIVDKEGHVAWLKEQAIGEARDDAQIVAELKRLESR